MPIMHFLHFLADRKKYDLNPKSGVKTLDLESATRLYGKGKIVDACRSSSISDYDELGPVFSHEKLSELRRIS